MIYDENANGDLRDDPSHAFTPIDGGFELRLAVSRLTKDDKPYPWTIQLRIRDGKLFWHEDMVRRGTLALDDHRYPFELHASDGWVYGQLWIDLDGDGILGPPPVAGESPDVRFRKEIDSPEIVAVAARTINIGTRTYDIAVEASGDTVTLTPRVARQPDRPSLQAGTTPPDFTVQDLDGHLLQLSALHGHPVLIDFWGTFCTPCVKALPALVELSKRHGDLEIVALAADPTADSVRELLRTQPHAGRVALYGDDLRDLYRVWAWPTYFLVGADGKLVLPRSHLDEVIAYLDARDTTGGHGTK